MRRAFAGLFSVTILLVAISVSAAEFKGRIIYVKDNVLEVKKRSREMTFVLTGETSVTRQGAKADVSDIAVCQIVKVSFKGEGKARTALRIDIVKDSDCVTSVKDKSE